MNQRRYEKEIEEILENAGEEPGEQPRRQGNRSPRRRSASGPRELSGRHFGLKYQYALIAGIVLILVGAVLGWLYFFLAGVALVVAGYVIYYRAPRGGVGASQTRRMWRGRPVDPD